MTEFKLVRIQKYTYDRLDQLRSKGNGKKYSFDTILRIVIGHYEDEYKPKH